MSETDNPVNTYLQAAEQGDAHAQYCLAESYWNGDGIVANYPEALKWYRRAAKQDHQEAQVRMALFYVLQGKVCLGGEDVSEAVKWLTVAAEQEQAPWAILALGQCYYRGEGVPKDTDVAAQWLSKLSDYPEGEVFADIFNISTTGLQLVATQGDAYACYRLGQYYHDFPYYDRCADQSDKAIKWLRLAAKQGYVEAQRELATCYLEGLTEDPADNYVIAEEEKAPEAHAEAEKQETSATMEEQGNCYADGQGVAVNQAEAAKWFAKAATKRMEEEDARLSKLAGISRRERETDEVVTVLKPKATEGDAEAQLILGLYFLFCSEATDSIDQALSWFRRAAEQNHAKAQTYLGLLSYAGAGSAPDYGAAVKWFTQAAEQGDAFATHRLGRCYTLGQGVAQDEHQAFACNARAAEKGLGQANLALCVHYAEGSGVAQDFEKAIECYRKYTLKAVKTPVIGDSYDYYRTISDYLYEAAGKGDVTAQYLLAQRTLYIPYECDISEAEEALDWLCKSARHGYAPAQYLLGKCHEDGVKVKGGGFWLKGGNFEFAKIMYSQAAEQGYFQAKYMIDDGCLSDEIARLSEADDCPRDQIAKLTEAAEQGDAHAQYCLAKRYWSGDGVVVDYPEALKWYRRVAKQGDIYAQYHLCQLYAFWGKECLGGEDASETVQWFTAVANKLAISYWVILALSRIYASGEGVPQDSAMAAKWLDKLADYSCYHAPNDLHEIAEFGLHLAAEQGGASACYSLGHYYSNRRDEDGCKDSMSDAIVWLRRAAEQGHAEAQYELASIYDEGCYIEEEGAEADAEALKWYTKAAGQGHAEAKKAMQKLGQS